MSISLVVRLRAVVPRYGLVPAARWSPIGRHVAEGWRSLAGRATGDIGFIAVKYTGYLNGWSLQRLQGSGTAARGVAVSLRAFPVRGFAEAAAAQRLVWVKKQGDPSFVKLRSLATDVDDLKEEIVKRLPSLQGKDLSTLTLHVEGQDGSLGPALDSVAPVSAALAGVHEPVRLVVRVTSADAAAATAMGQPAFPPLPPALSLPEVRLGDEAWLEAQVPRVTSGTPTTAPAFYTREQVAAIRAFIHEELSVTPRALMLVGTIKSGKSTLLHTVLPGLIAAEYATAWQAGRRRPVIFTYAFPLNSDAETAAMHLSNALDKFGRTIRLPFDMPSTSSAALNNLPLSVREFAESVANSGGELWLLLDELQGPGLGSTPADAARFTYTFKQLLEMCSPVSRIAVTGSGLVTLLNSFRTARVNGFVLWDATTFVGLGSEPSLPTAEEMAARMLESYAAKWLPAVREAITPQVLVDAFKPSALGGLTSTRPALLAYVLSRISHATPGAADQMLGSASGDVLGKVWSESVRDTLAALAQLGELERFVLREVASEKYTIAELMTIRNGKGVVQFRSDRRSGATRLHRNSSDALVYNGLTVGVQPDKLAALIDCLREKCATDKTSDQVRLQPPYGALLRGWLRGNGMFAISVSGDKIDLDFATRSNLVLISEARGVIAAAHLWGHATNAFWKSLLSNGIGFRETSTSADGRTTAVIRAPSSAEEFYCVDALARLNDMLDQNFLLATGVSGRSPSYVTNGADGSDRPSLDTLLRNEEAHPSSVPVFQRRLGRALILAFRHLHAHVWGEVPALVHNGLSAAVVTEAIGEVVNVLVTKSSGYFVRNPAEPRRLSVQPHQLTNVSRKGPRAVTGTNT